MTREEIKEKGRDILQEVRGARLTSVEFVLNYVILGFDGKGALTSLVWPELTWPDANLTFGMPGYRDRLCEFITKVVENVESSDDETITFTFREQDRIVIRLSTYEHPGERAIFTAPKNRLFTWS